ncbi:AAA family ATPase [Aestuariibius insulae]|uniref:AAA family ATPase n=1 Tax=Aestuariibius insulae TaxID=2058287 RepID=UPI00345E43E6
MAPERITGAGLIARLDALSRGRRTIIGIAGAPGSGKSTLADGVAEALGARAAVLPMDGYHYDDILLHELGRHARKGAPDTFDVDGLAHMIGRLRSGGEVVVPVFDRDKEIARAGARVIPEAAEIILVEGNYVLAGDPPWSVLRDAFELRVLIDVPEDELRRRLRQRWEHYALSEEAILAKLDENDLPNGRYVRSSSVGVDLLLTQEGPDGG